MVFDRSPHGHSSRPSVVPTPGKARTLGRVAAVSELIAEATQRYLRSGEYDHDHPQWPGQNVLEKAKHGHDDLLDALVKDVQRRATGKQHGSVPTDLDLVPWTRHKVTPMVEGLFPTAERGAVLALLERSVVFLTGDNIERVLREQRWPFHSFGVEPREPLLLSSVDAELLGPDAPSLLGLSQETTCFVSADYFRDDARFADYVIHEAAHVFHNWKRRYAGLPETRTREWLLEIEFRKRELFAYSHEGLRVDRRALPQSPVESAGPGERIRRPGSPVRWRGGRRRRAVGHRPGSLRGPKRLEGHSAAMRSDKE